MYKHFECLEIYSDLLSGLRRSQGIPPPPRVPPIVFRAAHNVWAGRQQRRR